MDIGLLKDLLWVIVPLVGGLLTYFYKEIKSDITMLKQDVATKTSETQVRQIIQDKVDPLKEDLNEIKQSLIKITDHIMKQH